MIQKIDVNSLDFQKEFENTKDFTNEVLKEHNLVFNPNEEIIESIQTGLTRNMIIYGKRYCPCFMVVEDDSQNRICPCKPALSFEIPNNGSCHCGIYCTTQKAEELNFSMNQKEAIATHFRGLTKKECEDLLHKDEINSVELEALLDARTKGAVDFCLVDTREWMEWVNARIKGTDFLVPTTSFYNALGVIEDRKDSTIIIYCHSGSRSAYCQRIMQNMGFSKVINLDYGIMSFKGELIRGEE